MATFWIGSVQTGKRDDEVSAAEREQITATLATMNCIPIFAPTELVDRAYLGYCKQILWCAACPSCFVSFVTSPPSSPFVRPKEGSRSTRPSTRDDRLLVVGRPSFHNVDMLDQTHAVWHTDSVQYTENPEMVWDQASSNNFWQAYVDLNQLFFQGVWTPPLLLSRVERYVTALTSLVLRSSLSPLMLAPQPWPLSALLIRGTGAEADDEQGAAGRGVGA